MTPIAVLLDSYVRKIEQLRRELDEALRRAETAENELMHLQRELNEEAD